MVDHDLADAFEAVLGAVYVDGGIAAVSDVFDRLFAADLEHLGRDPWIDNPKGRLQSLAQKTFRVDPVYVTLSETGPMHSRVFAVRVTVGEERSAEGRGPTKRAAQAAAAAALLRHLDETATEEAT